jgi:heptosyltransferase III
MNTVDRVEARPPATHRRSLPFRFSRHPQVQRVGSRAGRVGRRVLAGLLDALFPLKPSLALPAPRDVRSVLLVRPNFRIGNTLLLAPLVPALRERYPAATLDVLTGDRTAVLLDGLPIDRVHAISRLFLLRPWRFVALFLRLRSTRYDLVLEGGMGSLSGALYGWLAGGRRRVGPDGRGRRLLDVRLAEPRVSHVYDWAPAIARQLGARCEPRPIFEVLPSDAAAAREALVAHGLADAAGRPLPFVLVFPGGHQKKRWPDQHWLLLCERLARRGARVLVALGPEEHRLARPLRSLAHHGVRLLAPGSIRRFGAILSRARLVVTADSGPLHLSAAVGAPTVALLQREASRRYAPRGPHDRWVVAPTVDEAEEVVVDHPAWSEVVEQSAEAIRAC